MNFTIIIKSKPDCSYSGFLFAKATLAKKIAVKNIFFIYNGTYTANKDINMQPDEINIADEWIKLKKEHGINLTVCLGSAMRRGVNKDNLATEFELGSIGQLLESCENSDRVITF